MWFVPPSSHEVMTTVRTFRSEGNTGGDYGDPTLTGVTGGLYFQSLGMDRNHSYLTTSWNNVGNLPSSDPKGEPETITSISVSKKMS